MTRASLNHDIEAIILNRQILAEADLNLTLFDRRLGKIKAIAKKALLPTSHRQGYLEIGWYILSHGYQSKESPFFRLGRVEFAESFWDILMDLDQTGWFFRTLDLVDKNLPLGLPQPGLFDDLLALFEALNFYTSIKPEIDKQLIRLTFNSFEIKLLNHLGYWPAEKLNNNPKWRQVIDFLINKQPADILSLSLKGKRPRFFNQLQTFLDNLYQSLIEYKPVPADFFKGKNNENGKDK